MRQLPVDGPFDAVVCWLNSFGYYDDADCHRVLGEFHRVLRPGGPVADRHACTTTAVCGTSPRPPTRWWSTAATTRWSNCPPSTRCRGACGSSAPSTATGRCGTRPTSCGSHTARMGRLARGGRVPRRAVRGRGGGPLELDSWEMVVVATGLRPSGPEVATAQEHAGGEPRIEARRGGALGLCEADRCTSSVGQNGGHDGWHCSLGHLPALLAAPALGHRRGAGRRRRPGHARRGLLRRGHDHAGGRGGAPGAAPSGPAPRAVQDLFLSTPDPAYLDKTSATTVHAALGARRGLRRPTTSPARPARRSATLLQAWSLRATPGGGRTTLAVVSDLRTGLAGSAEERDSGDGAAAFVCAPEGAVAELVGRGAASDEFLDRWRVPGEADSHVWEERFGEELYVPLAREAFAAALKDAGRHRERRRPRDRDRACTCGPSRPRPGGLGVRDGVAGSRPAGLGRQPRGGPRRRGAVRRARAGRARAR